MTPQTSNMARPVVLTSTHYTMIHKLMIVAAVVALSACTSVDSTEHCVLTRYGKVVESKMDVGLNLTVFSDAECFTMTEKNFDPDEKMEAQTRDPITVSGDVGVIYKFDPRTIVEVFNEKRNQENAEVEILNAIREGYKSAIAKSTLNELFSNRPVLADSVKAQIQRKIGNRAIIQQVFIKDIKTPQALEQARIASANQALVLDKAQKQYIIDSVEARATVVKAEATAKAKQLEAQSYATNPKLLELEIAKAQSMGLANACRGANVQTCVIGGTVSDTWKR